MDTLVALGSATAFVFSADAGCWHRHYACAVAWAGGPCGSDPRLTIISLANAFWLAIVALPSALFGMILTSLTKFRDQGLLFLRVALGGFYIYAHGWSKLAGSVHAWREVGLATHYVGIHFAPVFWGLMAALSETVGCVLFILGCLFRPACLLLCITLCVASVMHIKKGQGWETAAQAVELAILFFSLLFIGPGKFSIDKS